MKVGIKVYSHARKVGYARKVSEFVDFIEVMVVPGVDVTPFRHIGRPIVIHAAHQSFDCNPADKTLFRHNVKCIKEAIHAADVLDARTIVLHPGQLLSDKCSVNQAIKTLLATSDSRIALENLPICAGDKGSFCSFADEMRSLMSATGSKLCLDFGHACAAANYTNRDYREVVEGLVKLKPSHFHLCGGNIKKLMDDHRSLFNGNYPVDYFKSLIPKNAWVTLETPQDLESQKRELRFMKK